MNEIIDEYSRERVQGNSFKECVHGHSLMVFCWPRKPDFEDDGHCGMAAETNSSNDPVNITVSYSTLYHENNDIVDTGVFWYRWYIVVLFGIFGCVQGAVWNTWGPINDSALCAFGIGSDEIDLLSNWGPIVFLAMMPFFAWLLNNKGLRPSVVSCTFLMALGCGLRCLPLPVHILKYFIHIGQFLNAVGGPVVMASPPLLSNVWFPPSERVTATGISTMLTYVGAGVGFLIGPAIVTQPPKGAINGTSCVVSQKEKASISHDIMTLLYIELGISVVIFLCTLIYYPNKPPVPPSVSASLKRLDFKKGVWSLRKSYSYIISTLIMAFVLGGYNGFIGAFNVIVTPLGIPQTTAGNIGFVSMAVGCVAGMCIGWLADRWKGHNRIILLVLFGIGFLSTLYFTIIATGSSDVQGFKFTETGTWISLVTMGLALNASASIGNELVAESGYPTGEGVSTGICLWISNIFSFTLLLVLGISSDNSYGMYLLLGSLLVAIILLFFIKEPETRLRIDDELEEYAEEEDDDSSPLLRES